MLLGSTNAANTDAAESAADGDAAEDGAVLAADGNSDEETSEASAAEPSANGEHE